MAEALVRVVSAADVACATTQTVSSAVLALEIDNEFLINTKRERRNVIEEVNKQIRDKVISLNVNSTRMQGSLDKAAGKLRAKFSKAKGGAERKKIKSGKTRIILQTEDTVDVGAVQDELQQTKVRCNTMIKSNVFIQQNVGGSG